MTCLVSHREYAVKLEIEPRTVECHQNQLFPVVALSSDNLLTEFIVYGTFTCICMSHTP